MGDSALCSIRQRMEVNPMQAGSLRDLCKNGHKALFLFSLFQNALIQAGYSENAYTTGSYRGNKQRRLNVWTGLTSE